MRPTSLFAAAVLGAAALGAPAPALGQQPGQQQPVQVVLTKIGSNFYGIDGQGGRMGALIGPDAIFMVDAQSAAIADRIVGEIRKVSDKPIKFLVNTHVHADHTGGNAKYAALGATLMSRPLLRERLAHPAPPANGGAAPAVDPMSLPTFIFDAPMTIYAFGEPIELIPILRAHTDGDTAIRFPMSNVLMTGDVFRSLGYPNIDLGVGGSLNGLITGLNQLIDLAGPDTKVLPGHGAISDRNAIIAHRDMVIVMRDRVIKAIKEGKTRDQIIAAKITADYDEKTGNAAGSADRFVGQLYDELKGTTK